MSDDGYLKDVKVGDKTYHISHYVESVYFSTSKKTGGTKLKNVQFKNNQLVGWIDKKWRPINDFQLGEFITNQGSSSGGCFISSVIYQAINNDDNCYELQTLRNFRDNVLLKDNKGSELVHEYYRIAPEIAYRLENKNDNMLYQHIVDNYLNKTIQHIEKQEFNQAILLYREMVEFLQTQV